MDAGREETQRETGWHIGWRGEREIKINKVQEDEKQTGTRQREREEREGRGIVREKQAKRSCTVCQSRSLPAGKTQATTQQTELPPNRFYLLPLWFWPLPLHPRVQPHFILNHVPALFAKFVFLSLIFIIFCRSLCMVVVCTDCR